MCANARQTTRLWRDTRIAIIINLDGCTITGWLPLATPRLAPPNPAFCFNVILIDKLNSYFQSTLAQNAKKKLKKGPTTKQSSKEQSKRRDFLYPVSMFCVCKSPPPPPKGKKNRIKVSVRQPISQSPFVPDCWCLQVNHLNSPILPHKTNPSLPTRTQTQRSNPILSIFGTMTKGKKHKHKRW